MGVRVADDRSSIAFELADVDARVIAAMSKEDAIRHLESLASKASVAQLRAATGIDLLSFPDEEEAHEIERRHLVSEYASRMYDRAVALEALVSQFDFIIPVRQILDG
jgi:hypothetical protein